LGNDFGEILKNAFPGCATGCIYFMVYLFQSLRWLINPGHPAWALKSAGLKVIQKSIFKQLPGEYFFNKIKLI
jgi:hypothetical protein